MADPARDTRPNCPHLGQSPSRPSLDAGRAGLGEPRAQRPEGGGAQGERCERSMPTQPGPEGGAQQDPHDWRYKKNTGLTRLRFVLKPGVEQPGLVPEFSVTLYPNSVLMIPLSTNRLYTHAIRPSALNVD